MWSRPQYTDLTTMGATGSYGPMSITIGSVIQSWYTSLIIKFGVNRTFHVLKTPVYGRYRALWTDDDNFWLCYLEVVYKPEYEIWCAQLVTSAQDPSLAI